MAIDHPADMEYYRLKYDSGRRSEWTEYLSLTEREQMERFGSEKRRREFLLGRVALRELLARHLGISPAEIPLYQASDGAPEVDGSDLEVSLSHSHGWAAAVVARQPVGIDMEYIQPRHERLYRHILHDRELEMFNSLPCPHHERQILCWTLKEATVKAVRPEERLSLKNMRITCSYAEREARVHVVDLASMWRLKFEKVDNFYLAIAYSASGIEPR